MWIWGTVPPAHTLKSPYSHSAVSRGSSAVQPGGEPVSDLHGLAHRLRSAGVRPHGHVYQVRQAHERMPYLPAVRDPSCARLPVLRPASVVP